MQVAKIDCMRQARGEEGEERERATRSTRSRLQGAAKPFGLAFWTAGARKQVRQRPNGARKHSRDARDQKGRQDPPEMVAAPCTICSQLTVCNTGERRSKPKSCRTKGGRSQMLKIKK